jgi:diguanylate cyclase (GGDEF)-like protein
VNETEASIFTFETIAGMTGNRTVRTLLGSLSRLVAKVPAYVWVVDRNLRYEGVIGGETLIDPEFASRIVGCDIIDIPCDGNVDHPLVRACRYVVEHGDPQDIDFGYRGRQFSTYMEPYVDDSGQIVGVVGLAFDVTDRRHITELLNREIKFDVLTGMGNRVGFREELDRKLVERSETQGSFGVLFVDVDRFKSFNEALGHGFGDNFLKQISKRISHAAGAESRVARWSGDQFVVLLSCDDDGRSAEGIAKSIVTSFIRPFHVDDQEVFATASVGLAVSPSDGVDPDRLMGSADAALHDAKERGGNMFRRYDSKLRARAADRFALERDLRRTVGTGRLGIRDLADDGFVLHFQPISHPNGTPIGAEALVRWNHPTRGLVPPDSFIPVAESTDMIIKLGEWVLRTALFTVRQWDAKGLSPMGLAVNISGRQFNADIVQMVERCIEVTGIDPRRLELELTESVLMKDVEAANRVLQQLKNFGCRISVDDFGTGYSSLSYLKRFPIDALKIDRSFTRDTPHDPDGVVIVQTIIALAHSLDLRVIAEGVENDEQRIFLQNLKCDELQGYFFSKPLPAADFLKYLLSRSVPQIKKPVRHLRSSLL